MAPDGPRYRRYLTNFDAARTGHVFTNVLVVGAGVAGSSAALAAAEGTDVIVLAKGALESSSTHWAQGGVAAVTGPADTIAQHARDTLTVGAGLNRRAAVEVVCGEGPKRIRDLIDAGFAFDSDAGVLALGLEAGHQEHRILHAGGDATGRKLGSFLFERARAHSRIRIFEDCFLIDLLTVDGVCRGAVTFHPKYGHQLIWAAQTILASGGYGQLYRETTNPPGITGDGIAAALRAGALVADMELMQFHPTTLYIAGSTRALISEAVRGEGALLVDRNGYRFMPDYHADGELAPRDIVSRAIAAHMKTVPATNVFLDVRPIGAARFAERFPTITARCAEFGIDVSRELIPVRPAAHFSIGGIVVDLDGRSTLAGLFACGESSCSGLHGANRLASNSLLEGLVFGCIAGRQSADAANGAPSMPAAHLRNENPHSPKTLLDLADVRQSLRSLLWRNAGIVRHGDRLAETVEIIDFWSKFTLDKTFDDPAGWEIQNMLLLGRLVADAAGLRRESRGVHYRADAPQDAADAPACHWGYTLLDGDLCAQPLDLDLIPMGT